MRRQRADGLPVARFPREHRAGGLVSTIEPTPRELAVWALRRAIRETARDVYAAEIVQVPIAGMPSIKRDALDNPLAGIGAALLTRDVANAELRTYAEEARGAGRSWDEVGEALGIEPAADGEPRDEQAYRLVIEGRPLRTSHETTWWQRPTARWTCSSCRQHVTDHGPFESHPDDVEQGHNDACGRRAAALADFDGGLG
jgi:hypothetical protein